MGGSPDKNPSLIYDENSRTVSAKSDDKTVELYSDIAPAEFEIIDEIDGFVTEATSLIYDLFRVVINQRRLVQKGRYFDRLHDLQHDAAEYFRQCLEYQARIEGVGNNAVAAQIEQLYKLNKFLKHYFRALTIGQSLGFSQRLILDYMQTEDYLYLYEFIRNVCSTVEYLGKLLESRLGEGNIDLNDKSITAFDVYEEVKRQGLDKVYDPEEEIIVPPKGEKIKLGDIAISTGSMKYLWDKRCDIAHGCPLVIPEEDVDHLPDEIVTTNAFTTTDLDKLMHLSFRVHFHSVSMFIRFVLSYLKKQVEAVVEAWYGQQEPQ